MASGKYNFSVKLNPKIANKKSTEENNSILVKKFMRKWKKSGILREIKDRQFPVTKGMKLRKKKHLGKRRAQRKNS
ncbi:MAG: hypothetical protein CBC29_05610 [Methylococcaceae bacterium TMED69]|nr:MAG: hypothetical protein CBC29_05610 [Methylococcaceae bacterium TMED69]|tara:strand:- start:2529 stop:2756 length:228 start_codon:yes stop_codon:yes gene_type:complete